MSPQETPSSLDVSADSNKNASHDEQQNEPKPTLWNRIVAFYWENEFLIHILIAILLARAYPPIGATYLAPDITATWLVVIFIFVMAGLGLKTSEFSNAFKQIRFNVLVQVYSFGVCSALVYGLSRGLEAASILSEDLANGMVICASLPMTINMCQILTKASNGDEASAVFNSAFGNLIGVFLSPLLILGYLGVSGDVDLVKVFYELTLRVVVPVLFGQLLQKTAPPVVEFYKKHKKFFAKLQQFGLVFIVYTVFCKTFDKESQSSIGDIFLMITFQFISLVTLMTGAWLLLSFAFPNQPKLRVFGLFGCTHKTVAIGIPLINSIYGDNPSVGLYTLPLLIWHPTQLLIGTALSPRLAKFVEREQERLGIHESDDEEPPQRQEDVEASSHHEREDDNGEVSTDINNR
ncbi:solute carrier family 10 (sodium/bile acid cotransporter), member 7 [Fistulifera solaris]|uniref:Solute carrier family 10 (Sodium/bile acid cotransporter), member 7 n=1 Tax=Fistulifera solaris TaxID=1519565 RepID=A0A1Z5JNR2_FISSO|nr:solute carrier family 10 (sodium/bile acid cotransporter), member 7 [Fistulifera solaris]|eukprot:GAX15647.1 solute carrier family 10 (sodium/bile acid cotransporter), member 7 [Fistulifera solaris]